MPRRGRAFGGSTSRREIVVLERDHYVSFANCGLPYHIGGAIPERESLLLQTPESLGKSLALDVRTGQDVLRIDRDAKEVEVRDLAEDRTLPRVLRQARALPRGRADPAADPGCRRPARRRAAQHPRHGPHHRPARRGRHERRRRRRQLHRAGAHRGLQGARAADHRRRADRAADAVAGPRDDADPRLPRRAPTMWTCGSARRPRRCATATTGRLVLDLSDGTSVEADVVVMAAGARPNVELARDAGLEIGPRGGIKVDAQMRTSDPDILAAGDAVETPHLLTGEPVLSMLAGPANREGRIAADTIAGRDSAYRGTQGTAVVQVFDMTAGGTGMTETELRAAGIDYRKVYDHHNGHAAYYPGTVAAVRQGAVRAGRGQAAGRPGAGLGRCRQAHRRLRGRAARRHDGLRPRAPRARLRPALRLGQGPGQHGRLPGRESAARRHRPLVPGGLPGVRGAA